MRKATKDRAWIGLLTGLAALAFPASRPAVGEEPRRPAAPEERAESGRRTYRVYCASCHGESGRGDGPVAGDLKVVPTDLTRLAARAGGEGRFPRDRVYQAIDGRLAVRGHGTSAMPVWGATFQVRGSDRDQEREIREQIMDLLTYLESLQAHPRR